MRWLRFRHPSPALVVSVVALFVALGGTSYAAFSIPRSSVGNRQLKDNSVSNSKLRNGSVSNAKLRPGSVSGANIKTGAITGSNLNLSALGTVPSATNAINAINATTATNATTAATASALGGVRYVTSGPIDNPANTQNVGSAVCPSGLFVIGGGASNSGLLEESLNSSFPTTTTGTIPNAWKVFMNNTSTGATATDDSFTVFAICAPESSPVSAVARSAAQAKTK